MKRGNAIVRYLGPLVAAALLAISPIRAANGQVRCPKVLMFDGLDITKRFDAQDAKYWATVGIDGFFVAKVPNDWTKSVGSDENSDVYRRVRRFQEIYASQGVSYNFLKIAGPYSSEPHFGWSHQEISVVVQHFREAAHLARYAGLRGVAVDVEPYQRGIWQADPAVPNKQQLVLDAGREIGGAILSQFPTATIIVIPEVLQYAHSSNYPTYPMSAAFWQGLIQSHPRQMVIATERSYHTKFLGPIAADTATAHKRSLQQAGVPLHTVSIAFGLWPLGRTYTEKTADETPPQFYERLRLAFAAGQPFVWIYGHGSAWQTNGPYGSGAVDPLFGQYVDALRRVKAECASHEIPLTKLPMRQDLWSLAR